jgi:hypothetical protein
MNPILIYARCCIALAGIGILFSFYTQARAIGDMTTVTLLLGVGLELVGREFKKLREEMHSRDGKG